MTDFEEIQAGLHQARREDEESGLAVLRARHQLLKVQRERAELRRSVGDDGGAVAQLDAREQALSAALAQAEEARAAARSRERRWLEEFNPFSDPRKGIGQLPDDIPLLLFPLRLETRFKQITEGETVRDELWVRVYPDDCLVDSFEELLSEAEVEAAQRYWIDHWRAAGSEAGRRAAWRGLVARFSSGRAAYIVQRYGPVEPVDPPPAQPPDVVLVVAGEDVPTPTERGPLAGFWRSVYRSPDSPSAWESAGQQLAADVGPLRAEELIARHVPMGLDLEPAPPLTRADVVVDVVYLRWPPDAEETTTQSWTHAPRVELLPDRLVLIAYRNGEEVLSVVGNPIPRPLIVGPDPMADPAEQIHAEDDELAVSPDMRWVVDFGEAVEKGMGFVVPLTPPLARGGFDRLLVVGVRTSLDALAGARRVEELFSHHRFSRKGFSLLPQGTPTNNTEDEDSGLSRFDDADSSFDDLFVEEKQLQLADHWREKQDGQWLAEWLGLDPEVFRHVRFADGTDQVEARAMNRALWPATWGYFLESMMHPLISPRTVERVRDLFNDHVLARGAVPAIRIGRQPYGILPTAPFSRIRWFVSRPSILAGPPDASLLQALYVLLLRIEGHWAAMDENVSFVGRTGTSATPQQVLLDIIGLHPASVEFHQRYAESLEHLFNQLKLEGFGGLLTAILLAAYVASGQTLLEQLGHTGDERPDILGKVFLGGQNTLVGDLIDDQPLSESAAVRSYTPDDRNYLRWLLDAARTSHDALRQQQGFTDNKRPSALLYLLLHHALDLSFYDTSIKLHVAAEVLAPAEARALRREAPFVHVAQAAERTESRWHYLYKTEARITETADVLIGDYIAQVVDTASAARYLNEQLLALERLEHVPTGRLERVLVEHLDTCNYRLDAWKLGLIHYQLARLRFQDSSAGPRRGVYVGAFGWLEDVRSEHKQLRPAEVPEDLRLRFAPDGSVPLVTDSTNAGYVHAPSLDHAVTAAVLRNGYLSNATPSTPDLLAVNLSSERVRLALGIVEGIRGGQSLGALLGYRLERFLHDQAPAVEVDEYIYKLRKEFPLVADRMAGTQSGAGDAIEKVEARNVVDGLALVEHVKATGQRTYPFGRDLDDDATPAQRGALNAAVQHILDVEDAVADLAVAESVHQVVRGNFTRAAATLETYSRGNFPPIPEVALTPRTGTSLTHRVGVQLDAAADPDEAPNGIPPTPRSRTEPAMNRWLAGLLPDPDHLGCRVRYFHHGAGADVEHDISQADLGLQPLDLLYLLDPRREPTLTALDDHVLQHLHGLPNAPRPDAVVEISYRRFRDGDLPFFELSSLLASLREVLVRSRPLAPTDVAIPHEVDADTPVDTRIEAGRLQPATDFLAGIKQELDNVLLPHLAALLADPVANHQAIVDGIDELLEDWGAVAGAAGRCGLTQAGMGGVLLARGAIYRDVVDKVGALLALWDQRLVEYLGLLAEAAAATVDEGALVLLEEAERKISTEGTVPRPGTPLAYLTVLDGKRTAFEAQLQNVAGVVNDHLPGLSQLFDGLDTALPAVTFDPGFDLAPERKRVVALAQDVQRQATTLRDEIGRRLDLAAAKLAQAGAAANPREAVAATTEAARALLGEEFAILPRFRLGPGQQAEWQNAYQQRTGLLEYLQPRRAFPVDDWLHGVARVREKLWHWENVTVVADALTETSLSLEPIQLPFRVPDYWLGLEYPDTVVGTDEPFLLDEDKVLYTAHYAVPFDPNDDQCGLLLDEWNETMPAPTEDTGLTFHYDRPNSEPPQSLLLALPAELTGRWQWQDVVDTLHETLAMVKQRAREPRQVESTAYARFLPATVSAVTYHPLTIALDYAVVNNVAAVASVRSDVDR